MDEFTYAEVGATRDATLPTGYRHLRHVSRLDRDAFAAAAEAVLTFRILSAAGERVEADAPRAAPGVEVTSWLQLGPLHPRVPCRVVWTEESPERVGFAYGTLPGHPARGEESFVVTRDERGDVWFTITSFSRPATWYMRAAGPLAPLLQAGYARLRARALRRMIRTNRSVA